MDHLDGILALDPSDKAASMSIYSMKGSQDVQKVLLDAYAKVFSKNNLVTVLMPGTQQIEQELLSMCANLLSGGREGVVTNITSGGTESIFCAINAARQWARETKPHIKEPEFVVPYSAHATLGKAGHYLDVKIKRVPVGADYRADIEAIKGALSENTIGLYASAPNWPYGTYDRVEEFGQVALEHDLWLHGRLCGRVHGAIRVQAWLRYSGVGFLRTGRYVDLCRPAQICLCDEARLGCGLEGPVPAEIPLRRNFRLADHGLFVARIRGVAFCRSGGCGLGGNAFPGGGRIPRLHTADHG